MAGRWWCGLTVMTAAATWGLLSLTSCSTNGTHDGLETVTIKDRSYHLEISSDQASRTKGLMERTSIPADGGMLFVFPEPGMRSFWMKNCVIDMDLIFLDARGRVTATHRMKAEPPRRDDETELAYEARIRRTDYSSGWPAQFAIELQAGMLDQLDIGVEDKIPLDLRHLKALAR